MTLTATEIKTEARRLGFDACGITTAEPTARAAFLKRWIEEGRAGDMGWLEREPERRADPRLVLPEAASVIVVGLNYYREAPAGRARVARYALGDDYHDFMTPRLWEMAGWIERETGARAKPYVDTGPVMERPLAQRAGLGWQGKSTMLIHKDFGPWLLLGEIITTLALEPDAEQRDHCGKCSRCMDACPTGAITAPYQLDARRCISHLTIELKGSIPEPLRPLIGDRVYGCDECLDVCPWNRFARLGAEERFAPRGTWDLHELLRLTPSAFKIRFRGSPVLRIKRRGLLRNVCVVLGNIGTEGDLPPLREAALDSEPLVREHAAWAVAQIEGRISLLPNSLPSPNTGLA